MGRGAIQHDPGEEREFGWKADLLAKILAAVSAVSFAVFVLALMAVTDPVTASVLGQFRPHLCVVTETFRNSGATVCENWSSCKNLCANPPALYKCVHIYVRVYVLDNNDTWTPKTRDMPQDSAVETPLVAANSSDGVSGVLADQVDTFNSSSGQRSSRMEFQALQKNLQYLFPKDIKVLGYRIFKEEEEAVRKVPVASHNLPAHPVRFFVNAAGCGYEINCTEFQLRFNEVGAQFPCLYSTILNRTTPIDVPDVRDELVTSVVSAAVPALISIFSLAYLCVRGHCDFPRMVPRHVILRMIQRKKKKARKQLRLMQKRGSRGSIRSMKSMRSMRSVISVRSAALNTAPTTPQSMEWKKRPLPDIRVDGADKMENDLVVQVV